MTNTEALEVLNRVRDGEDVGKSDFDEALSLAVSSPKDFYELITGDIRRQSDVLNGVRSVIAPGAEPPKEGKP